MSSANATALVISEPILSSPLISNLNYTLVSVYQSYQTYLETEEATVEFNPGIPLLRIEENYIEVELIPRNTLTELVNDLSSLDFSRESSSDRALIGELPILELAALLQLPSLALARPHYQPITEDSPPTTTDDLVQEADNNPSKITLKNPFIAGSISSKLGFHLANLYHRAQENSSSPGAAFPFLSIEEEQVAVELVAQDNSSELLTDLSPLDFTLQSSLGQVISGKIAIDQLDQLAELDSLNFVRPVYQPIPNVGSTTSQADVATQADLARENFDVTGEGVTIGILSDSYDNLGGANSDLASGDLPSDINVLSDLSQGGSDEGRAMLQLVHDLAPDADLAFHTAFGGKTDFAQGILALADAGADIIVDDVVYLNEPFFQDGIVAQSVDQVVEEGVAYFSSAGNSGRQSYESEFRASGQIFDLGRFQLEAHDFDPSSGVDLFQEITVPTGAQVSFSFQWDDPFFSASGNTGATNDVDIFLLDEDNTSILAGSLDFNIGNDPVEIFSFVNDGSFNSNQFNLAIGKTLNSGTPDLMKYVGFGNFSIEEFDTQSSTIFGHANAEGAEAVGAAFFQDTPAFGTNPPEIENFSSAGNTPILYDIEGNRLEEAEIRQKPEIVAPDGTNTTFFGSDLSSDRDFDPNFFGTSAAAPHAAAVAGLLKEADPSFTPTEIYNLLETTAIDMDDPSTEEFDVGYDEATGYGLIQADQALNGVEETLPNASSTRIASDTPVFGSLEGDTLEAGVTFNSAKNPVFSGEGDDRVEVSSEEIIHRLYGGNNDDYLVVGSSDRAFAGAGDDTIEAAFGRENRLYGGTGNDTIIAGYEDRVIAGDGEDRLFLSEGEVEGGGSHLVTGGADADQFWIANGQRAASASEITDFIFGEDVLGIAGIEAVTEFNDLTITSDGANAVISVGDSELARVLGVNVDQLTADQFVIQPNPEIF